MVFGGVDIERPDAAPFSHRQSDQRFRMDQPPSPDNPWVGGCLVEASGSGNAVWMFTGRIGITPRDRDLAGEAERKHWIAMCGISQGSIEHAGGLLVGVARCCDGDTKMLAWRVGGVIRRAVSPLPIATRSRADARRRGIWRFGHGGRPPNATSTPGFSPGLFAAFPGISPLFERFLFASRPGVTAQKALICWGLSGRSGRI